jgi:hypothetical protein
VLCQMIAPGDPAGDTVAQQDNGLANRFAVDQIVEGREAVEFGGRQAEQVGDFGEEVVADVTPPLLDEFQRIVRGGARGGGGPPPPRPPPPPPPPPLFLWVYPYKNKWDNRP